MSKGKRRNTKPQQTPAGSSSKIDWKLLVAILSVCASVFIGTLAYRLSSRVAAMNESAAEGRLVSEAPPINVVWDSNYRYYCAFPHNVPDGDRARNVLAKLRVENVGPLPLERFSINVYGSLDQQSFLRLDLPHKGVAIATTNLDATGGTLPAGRNIEIDLADALRRARFPIETIFPGGATQYVGARKQWASGYFGQQVEMPVFPVKSFSPLITAGWRALYFRVVVSFFSRGTEYTKYFVGMMGLGYPMGGKLSRALWESDFVNQAGLTVLRTGEKTRQILIPQPVHVTETAIRALAPTDAFYTISLDGRDPNLQSKAGFWFSELKDSYWEPRHLEVPGSQELPPESPGPESAATTAL
jgi:hypothetical protein